MTNQSATVSNELKKCTAEEKTDLQKKEKKTFYFIFLCGLRFSMKFTSMSNKLLAFKCSQLNKKNHKFQTNLPKVVFLYNIF